eukprot:TRINITY_DN9790_c0_g3_i2.p1 TRINITY_DN9790_c0_g3~~TRINITY_DN9790_c0_g3_i2.p1  ORF type:complete len:199 (+),score=20.09 TRINITY_DN9790_c0_g3_i2:339-935(+)
MYGLSSTLVGMPYYFYSGAEGDYNVLVVELLGHDLEDLAASCGGKFTVPTTFFIANQALSRIKHLHGRFYIHRDIKPQNMAIGTGKRANTIYLFDFGLVKRYFDARTQRHISYRVNKKFTGTVRYASLNAHRGIEQSRRDDLESLGFVLVYLAKGSLPWQGLENKKSHELTKSIVKTMSETSVDELCSGLPSTICESN